MLVSRSSSEASWFSRPRLLPGLSTHIFPESSTKQYLNMGDVHVLVLTFVFSRIPTCLAFCRFSTPNICICRQFSNAAVVAGEIKVMVQSVVE